MKKRKKVLFRIITSSILLVVALFLYDFLLFPDIPKKHRESFRVGYINLNKSLISKSDLVRMQNMNCDMWLFLEWNGDNLDAFPSFISGFQVLKEDIDRDWTYGTLILSKIDEFQARTFNDSFSYKCDYNHYKICRDQLSMYLLHAPPPLPGCNYETDEYLEDARKFIEKDSTQNQIVVGDFNTFPFQAAVKQFKELGFKDAFNNSSFWPTGTFAPLTWFPKLMKYDYVLNKGEYDLDVKRFKISTSDHAGYIIDILE